MITFNQVKEEDLSVLANLYGITNLNINEENWTYSTALSYINYFYHNQSDLFICAYDDKIPIGGIMSTLKPSYNGLHLTNIELFISEDYKEQNIEKKLLELHLELASAKYDVSDIDTIIYNNNSNYPLDWYKKIGFKPNNNLTILNSNLDNCIKKLREEL